MFRRKSKETKYEKILGELSKLENGTYDNEFKESKVIYQRVKKYYEEKLKEPNFDLRIEKIRLEENVGKYNSTSVIASFNFFIAFFCAMVPVYLNISGLINCGINRYLSLASFIIFVIAFTKMMTKDVDKIKPKDIVNFICLRVIDDLQKDLENNIKMDKSDQDEEIAATNERKIRKKYHKRIIKKVIYYRQ